MLWRRKTDLGRDLSRSGEEFANVPQGGEIVQRKVFIRHIDRNLELLSKFAHHLGLLDAVDAQVRLQVGVHFDDVFRVAGLFDNEAH